MDGDGEEENMESLGYTLSRSEMAQLEDVLLRALSLPGFGAAWLQL